jgi:hypothetical protein
MNRIAPTSARSGRHRFPRLITSTWSRRSVVLGAVRASICETPPIWRWVPDDDAFGTPPFERANHSAVLCGSKLYIYGGHDSTSPAE